MCSVIAQFKINFVLVYNNNSDHMFPTVNKSVKFVSTNFYGKENKHTHRFKLPMP